MMEFHGSSMSIMVMIMCLSVVSAAYPFKISEQEESAEVEGNNRKFEQAAMIEARGYICGTDESSAPAMTAGMRETGLPEDIAVEIVSDLASGIIDDAQKSGSKKICGKVKVQLSDF